MYKYTAIIRRQPGGYGLKCAKRTGGSLFMTDTCASNVATFIEKRWPRHVREALLRARWPREPCHASLRVHPRPPCSHPPAPPLTRVALALARFHVMCSVALAVSPSCSRPPAPSLTRVALALLRAVLTVHILPVLRPLAAHGKGCEFGDSGRSAPALIAACLP